MKESSADIQQYLKVIQGNFGEKEQLDENHIINLGVATGGAELGDRYSFENGLRWLQIIEESDQFWLIEHGYVEYEADTRELLSKHDLARMISRGEMVFEKFEEFDDDLLLESFNNDEFDIFMESVDKYLLVNYQIESQFIGYSWKEAFERGLSPNQAVEEAILLEG